MKKLSVLLVAVAMFATSANAVIGYLIVNVPLIVVGAVVAAVDSGVVVHCVSGPHFSHCSRRTVITGVAGLIGLLLLDGERGRNAVFAELTPDAAAKLGVKSASKVDAYNHELAEINAVREEIVSDVLTRASRGESVRGAEIHAQWLAAQAEGLISPEAFEVLEAVSRQLR